MNFLDKMYPPGGVSPFKNNGALRSGSLEHPPKLVLVRLDDRQMTHLICVRLRHLLYDFFRECFGPSI